MRRGRPDAARQVLEEGIAATADRWLAVSLARVHLGAGRLADARACLPELDPTAGNGMHLATWAEVLAATGEHAQAARMLEGAGVWFGSQSQQRGWWLYGRARVLGDAAAGAELRRLVEVLRLPADHPLRSEPTGGPPHSP